MDAPGIAVSHEDIVAEYQRRLSAVTHENVMLGIVVQQQAQQLATGRAPQAPQSAKD